MPSVHLTFRPSALAALLTLALFAGACGSDDGDIADEPPETTTEPAITTTAAETADTSSTTDSPVSDAASPAFPTTITHGLGETTIEAEPQRIVALGPAEADALVAMGITPVGITGTPTTPGAIPAAWGDAVDPSDVTFLIPDAAGVHDLEEIAALDPDLILAVGAVVDLATYDLMTEIAPTVPFLTELFVDPWQDVTTMVGRAVGRPDDAAAAIAAAGEAADELVAEVPALDGATYTFNVLPAPGTVISVTEPADSANRFLAELGMTIAPTVADLPRQPGTGAAISAEQADLVDADVVLLFAVSEEAAVALLDNPTFGATGAAEAGRVVPLTLDQALAVRSPGALTIPWLLEDLRPALTTALG